jgi:hypothetical protein
LRGAARLSRATRATSAVAAVSAVFSLAGRCNLHEPDRQDYLLTDVGVINEHPVNTVGDLAPIRAARTPAIYE